MSKFSHLDKLKVKSDKTSVFDFTSIEGNPKLTVAPATEQNKPFYNALLKRSKKMQRLTGANAVNTSVLDANRREDQTLYSKYVVRSWEDVKDADGNNVPFNAEDCLGFLQALPDYMFDELRVFCSNPGNFVEEDNGDDEDLAKN